MSTSSPFRLLPVVVGVILVFAILRAGEHLFDQESAVTAIAPALAQEEAQDQEPEAVDPDAAGSGEETSETAEALPEEELDPEATGMYPETMDENSTETDGEPLAITSAEQEVLESLQARRLQLDQREDDLLVRERLLQAAELRLGQRIEELRAIEARIDASFGRYEQEQREQLESLVGMYENMKPKDAARIFDRLDLSVLVEVVEQMQTRKMAPILAKMDPAIAERLTVELAARASMRASEAPEVSNPGELQDP